MPTIDEFDGIKILMYWDEHPPPHFHVERAEFRASIEIATGELMAGSIDRRTLRRVQEWNEQHRDELNAMWELCQLGQHPTMTTK